MSEAEMPEVDELAWEQAANEHELAAELVASGNLDAAEPAALAAAKALLDVVGDKHPDYASALLTVGLVAEQRGRLREAIELGERALAILDRYHDEPIVDPIRAAASTQLAYRLALAGRYAEAERLSREALALTPNVHPLEANAWINLGVSLRLAGRHENAEAAYSRATALYEHSREPIPTGLHHNLAGLAFARGEHALAEMHARAALAARERSDDEDTFGRGQDLCGLGDALAGQSRLSEAEQAYREGLDCYARAGRAEHVEVAFALHNLADVLADQQRVSEAEACYERTLALKRERLGAAHHEVAASLSNLAVLYAGSDRLAQALVLSNEAVAIVSSLDEQHPVRIGVQACARSLA
jgi:tetratricopeptide (TPR) repeat protein